ncbi:ECs_2282 family putative zinc-binding protein [Halomonas denitrificans]|uniref:ECs_2282 family putative zinc-binding protein n=1 Tax=Halomonas denitrificans TaxID=370769 RepID=UPI00398F9918
MENGSFKCPECGGQNIKVPAETKSLEGMTGAICVDCSREFTKDDVIAQAREVAINRVRDAIQRSPK